MAGGDRIYSQTVNNNMQIKTGEEGLEEAVFSLVTDLVKMSVDEIFKMEAHADEKGNF
jgi:hypothetical protein